MDMPEAMCVGARFVVCDPARFTGVGRDLAVKAHRELGSHKRTASHPVLDVELVESAGSLFVHSDGCLYARTFQHPEAGAVYSLVGIRH